MSSSSDAASWRGIDLAIALGASVALIYLGTAAFRTAAASDSSSATSQGNVEATLTHATGAVRSRPPSSLAWRAIMRGAKLVAGDGIFVPDGGQATVTLNDSSVLELGPRTLVVIRSAVVQLSKGNLVASSAGAQPLSVDTGSGVIVELGAGSSAAVARTADKGTVVEPLQGRVNVRRASSQGSVANESLMPGEVANLGPAGERIAANATPKLKLLSPPVSYRLRYAKAQPETNFRWSAVKGCNAYTLTVSPASPTTGRAAKPKSYTSAAAFLPRSDLPQGELQWSVRCKEDSGVEHQSPPRTLFVTENPAPVAYHPALDADVLVNDDSTLSLAWTRLVHVDRYRVELAAGHRFATPVHTAETRSPFTELTEQKVPEGPYCFRVKGVVEDGSPMPWSKERCFQVIRKPRIGAPRLLDATFEPVPEGAP